MAEAFRFEVDDAQLGKYLLSKAAQFAKAPEAIQKANRESVDWLAQRASATLADRVHRYPDVRNPMRLAEIVASPEVSEATSDGFQFLISARVAELSARAEAYYRVIEGSPGETWGSTYWVDRSIRLMFYGPEGRNQAARPNRGSPMIHITQGVRAYHYASDAVDSFVKGRLWWKFAYAQLDGIGLNLRPGARV